ncbi:hypothetical protein AAKU52_001390 [Pedobacter sp. CG_S7]|uniref:hypothetical protein n=1 Tax=Pedobacter sp. CG_S7 TaxID=3143930 RepID=UPI003390E85E
MKRIYITIFFLLSAMVTLAYLYFSKLNRDTNDNEISLYAATANSGLIFCFQNDKSVLDLLKSQDLLQRLLPEKNLQSLHSLQKELMSIPEINKQLKKQDLYLSFIPGENKELTFLLSTQTSTKQDPGFILNLLKSKGIAIEKLADFAKITLKDSSTYYFVQKNNLLLLSESFKAISEGLKATEKQTNPQFIAYIKTNLKFSKNSVAALFINFNYLQGLQEQVTPEKFKQENGFANYNYSFSKDRILFNGSTILNDKHSYQNLFSDIKAGKFTIDAILPEETANYTIYVMNNYQNWRTGLNSWFIIKKKNDEIIKTIKNISTNYNLDLESTFPKYFDNQIVTFQLKSKETFGAINLSNGDKLRQLLLDVSSEYSDDIKMLKEPNLLYAYFGEPFEKFKKPYYTIIDNYMVFSNYPSSIQVFLNSYKNDKQLINNKAYIDASNQLSAETNILFYFNRENSENIANSNLYLPYLQLFKSDKKIGRFNSFIYQLNSDHKKFQTNLLISTTAESIKDTIPSFSVQ